MDVLQRAEQYRRFLYQPPKTPSDDEMSRCWDMVRGADGPYWHDLDRSTQEMVRAVVYADRINRP